MPVPKSTARSVGALIAMSLSTFAYVTTETLPIGLLLMIANDLESTVAAVGLLVTGYALVVVVASVPLTHLTRRVPRRQLLSGLSRTGLDGGCHPTQEVVIMAAPRKYPDDLRERAIRLVLDAKADRGGDGGRGACRRVGEQLGINPETLRGWVAQAEIDAGSRAGTTSEDAARIAALEKENRELRRANAILRSASAFFAAELDRP